MATGPSAADASTKACRARLWWLAVLVAGQAFAAGAPLPAPSTAAETPLATPDEAGLRAADREQMRILVERDLPAQEQMLHPNFLQNVDAGRVLRRRQALERLARSSQVDRFERNVDAVTITGPVGIVTGSENVVPSEDSDLRRQYGDATLERRFTNVYLFDRDRWRLLARQATPVKVTPVPPPRSVLGATVDR